MLHFYRYNFECLGNKIMMPTVLSAKEAIINSRRECFEKYTVRELSQYPAFLDGRAKDNTKKKKGSKTSKLENVKGEQAGEGVPKFKVSMSKRKTKSFKKIVGLAKKQKLQQEENYDNTFATTEHFE